MGRYDEVTSERYIFIGMYIDSNFISCIERMNKRKKYIGYI